MEKLPEPINYGSLKMGTIETLEARIKELEADLLAASRHGAKVVRAYNAKKIEVENLRKLLEIADEDAIEDFLSVAVPAGEKLAHAYDSLCEEQEFLKSQFAEAKLTFNRQSKVVVALTTATVMLTIVILGLLIYLNTQTGVAA